MPFPFSLAPWKGERAGERGCWNDGIYLFYRELPLFEHPLSPFRGEREKGKSIPIRIDSKPSCIACVSKHITKDPQPGSRRPLLLSLFAVQDRRDDVWGVSLRFWRGDLSPRQKRNDTPYTSFRRCLALATPQTCDAGIQVEPPGMAGMTRIYFNNTV